MRNRTMRAIPQRSNVRLSENGDEGVQSFAFILSVILFVGFDFIMFVTSIMSPTLHWLCWLYFLWMHSAKMLRCHIDRCDNPSWARRTNNVTEAVGATIGFLLCFGPWQGRPKGFVVSFFLAYFVAIISSVMELYAKRDGRTPNGVKRLVWGDNSNNTSCVVCQDLLYIGDTYLRMPCQHALHDDCGRTWFEESQECPVCRINCG